MARRAGIDLGLDRFDELSRATPVIADIAPTGRFLMEDFAYSGGLRGLLARITDLLALDARTVTGRTLGEELAGAEVYDDEVIRPRDRPVGTSGGLAVLRGSLAPDGAVIKPLAGEERLRSHEGPAVVFDDIADLSERIDDASLDVSEDSVSCSATPAPSRPECPSGGCCPCLGPCSRMECETWCGSPTHA